MTTTTELLAGLNEDQKKPVLDFQGPSFIVAGPGAGKTRVIVFRTNYMIEACGINPDNIMLFTFTNKAANEIKDRVVQKIGDKGKKITVGTYHSICARLLRKYGECIGYSQNFTIFDDSDSKSLMKKLAKMYEVEPEVVLKYISECKNKMCSCTDAMLAAQTSIDKVCAELYEKYQRELYNQGAMDFDDLIYYTIIMLERNPDVLDKINKRYLYVTADEFHDSSPRDIRLMELLAGPQKNICFILDDEQSIYGFRGADIDAVLGVRDIFNLKTFVLKQNYRSTKNIVNAARSLISKNKNQIDKTIFTVNEEGTPVVYFEEESIKNQSLRVMKTIAMLHNKHNIPYKEIAVLYRMSYLSRAVEDSLLTAGIPYKIVGGTPFYARKEVKDILSYARLLYNPFDFEAFKRAITVPKRGISDKTIDKIFQYARSHEEPMDFITAMNSMEFTGKAYEGVKEFNHILSEVVEDIDTSSASVVLNKIVSLTNYRKALEDGENQSKVEEKMANLVELIEISTCFDTIEDFLNDTSLNAEINEEETSDNDRVQLMTMHASKGLEYEAIIIIDANEGIIPHWKADTEKELEEERRLFYVAMTRAKKYLFITRTKVMLQNGKPVRAIPSRFVRDIDVKYIYDYYKKKKTRGN